jgi:hypothetical protein
MSILADLFRKKEQNSEQNMIADIEQGKQPVNVEQKPKSADELLLEELKQIKSKSNEEYEKASNTDRIYGLVEGLNKALALKDQARMLKSVKVPGMQAMGTDLKLDAGKSKEILDRRKSDIESLLSEYKLKQSLKPAGPKTMKVGDRLVSVDQSGQAKELYKPTESELDTRKKQLEVEQAEKNIQLTDKNINKKPGDDLTPEQKQAVLADIELKQLAAQEKKQKIEQNPEMSKTKKLAEIAKIDNMMAGTEKTRAEIKQIGQAKQLSPVDEANIGKIKAQTGYYQSKAATPPKDKPSEGEKTLDKEFAKKYNDWNTGGRVDYLESKKIFEKAIKDLESGKIKTGGVEKAKSFALGLAGIPTATKEAESTVRKAINGMLRATLGSAFTEEEGERIFKQTFDPAASPEKNRENIQVELNKIEGRAKALEEQGEYFKKSKTLAGFGLPDSTTEKPEDQGTKKDSKIEQYAKQYNMDYKQAEQLLKSRGYNAK